MFESGLGPFLQERSPPTCSLLWSFQLERSLQKFLGVMREETSLSQFTALLQHKPDPALPEQGRGRLQSTLGALVLHVVRKQLDLLPACHRRERQMGTVSLPVWTAASTYQEQGHRALARICGCGKCQLYLHTRLLHPASNLSVVYR